MIKESHTREIAAEKAAIRRLFAEFGLGECTG